MRSDKDFLTFLKGIVKGKRAFLFASVLLLLLFLVIFPKSCGESAEAIEDEKSETEARIEELCSSVEGVGKCRVMVTLESDKKGEEGRVYSVAVVCEGAENAEVRLKIKELISSLYGIGKNRISVVKMGK